MGTRNITTRNTSDFGARGAYQGNGNQDLKKLRKVCLGVMNYLKNSGTTINGVTYGSDKLFLRAENLTELYGIISRTYWQEYGEPLPFTPDVIAVEYGGARRGNYENFRDDVPVPRESHPLFGDLPEDGEAIATLYAYWGSNQKANRRLVKIGYTAQPLGDYLRNLERAYDPRLLATRCGGRNEEKIEHAKWRIHLAEGREWFYPVSAMFDAFRREWKPTCDFEIIVAEALRQGS